MILTTQRLALEPLQVAHAESLFPGFADERLYEFFDKMPHANIAAMREDYARILAGPGDHPTERWVNYAIRESATSRYLGMIQTSVFANDYAYLAYFVFAPHQGNGFAREACVAVLNQLRAAFQIKRVVAEMDVRNVASWKLVTSLGFERVSTTENVAFFKGASSTEYRFELAFTEDLA